MYYGAKNLISTVFSSHFLLYFVKMADVQVTCKILQVLLYRYMYMYGIWLLKCDTSCWYEESFTIYMPVIMDWNAKKDLLLRIYYRLKVLMLKIQCE